MERNHFCLIFAPSKFSITISFNFFLLKIKKCLFQHRDYPNLDKSQNWKNIWYPSIPNTLSYLYVEFQAHWLTFVTKMCVGSSHVLVQFNIENTAKIILRWCVSLWEVWGYVFPYSMLWWPRNLKLVWLSGKWYKFQHL